MKAVVLFSGGLDSTVALAIALEKGRECHCLSFDYGQRHRVELEAAAKIAKHYSVSHEIVIIPSQIISQSALLGTETVPKNRTSEEIQQGGIPPTYVPARNSLFLSYAMGFAEVINAQEIYYGANALDHNAYPDCHPRFVVAFQNVLNVATKAAIEGRPPQLIAPLLHMDKEQIVAEAKRLNVPIDLTMSCYSPTEGGEHCKSCDACHLRFNILETRFATI